MRYSIEPRKRRYIKGCGFLSFAKKSAEATGDLIGNKIADKITAKPSKKSQNEEIQSNEVNNEIPKDRDIPLKERI